MTVPRFRILLLAVLAVAVATVRTDDPGISVIGNTSPDKPVGVDSPGQATEPKEMKITVTGKSNSATNEEHATPVEERTTEQGKSPKNGTGASIVTTAGKRPSEAARPEQPDKHVHTPRLAEASSQGSPKHAESLKVEKVIEPAESQKLAATKSEKSHETKYSESLKSADSVKLSPTKSPESTTPTKEHKNGKSTTLPKSESTTLGAADLKWEVNAGKSSTTPVERPLRILAVIPFTAKSHYVMFGPLFQALAARGHKIDVLSHHPLDDPPPNYRDLSVRGSCDLWDDALDMDVIIDFTPVANALDVWSDTIDVCSKVIEHPVAKELRDSTERYDLVITELFGSECLAGFGYKYQVPTVGLISSVAPPSSLDRLGNPDNPAYISNYYLPYPERMTFWQRLVNTFFSCAFKRLKYLMFDRYTDTLARSFFGPDLPSSAELARNTSLILVNSHFSSNQARPMVPGVVEVGGLHIKESKPLPEDLERFVAESEAGVVVFSLGTMVRLGSWDEERLRALWGALGALPQRVLLKSKDPLPDAPPNVRVVSWLPQLDLLTHPKVVAFVTHGGLMGTQEAVWAGVPMLGIPLFADQQLNLATYASKGIAIVVEYHDITQELLLDALKQLTQDPGFRERAAAVSRQFRDRPRSPLEEAVWWVEYVVRHGGAPHLKSAAADLPLHQLLLLDVIGALLLAAAVAFGFIWFSLATIYRFIGFGSKGDRGRRHLPSVSADGQRKRYTKTKQH